MNTRHLRVAATAFFVLHLVSVFTPTLPEGSYSDAKVRSLYDDSGALWRAEIGGYALTLAALALLAFVALLSSNLAAHGEREGWLRSFGAAVGTVWAVMLMVAATAYSGVAAGINVGELEAGGLPVGMLRALSNQGFYALLGPGLLAAGALVFTVGRRASAVAALPRWCVIAAYVVAPLCLVPFWPTQFLPPLWVLCAGMSFREPVGSAAPARLPQGRVRA